MDSHLRLYMVLVPEKKAVVTVEYFYASGERTVAWLQFERLSDGRVLYSLRQNGTGKTTRGAAPTTQDAILRATTLVEGTYGPVAHPIGFDYRDGLDDMGLWTALGVDSELGLE